MINLQLHPNVLVGFRTQNPVHIFHLLNQALRVYVAQYMPI